MTAIDPHALSAATTPARAPALPAKFRVAFALSTCFVLATLLALDQTDAVWRGGAFFDTDDATRAVQLRQWLGGQGWYDLSITRMGTPDGVLMHWSRVVDVPLAALTFFARLFLNPEMAERFVRLVFPAGLFIALMLATGSAATALADTRARIAAIVLCFLGAPFLGQFVPGRIDHHAPQILLLVMMTGASLRAFEPRHARSATVAGICAALSLAISLENLPFIAIISAAFAFVFIATGTAMRRALAWFAVSFAASLVVLFFATIGSTHRLDAACDAYSLAHLAAGLAGCGALLGLSALSPRLRSVRARAFAVAACASLPVFALGATAPNCIGDPFVGLDPLVRDIWLRNVGEVEPLPAFLGTHFWAAVAMLLPLVCAGVTAIIGALRSQGVVRARNALMAALIVMAVAMTFWGIRTFSSGLPLVAIVGAPFILAIAARFATSPATRVAALFVAGVPFAPLALALLLPADATAAREGGTLSCLTPEALAPLAQLPAGNVLAPVDAGAHLLAFTPHTVYGAPYHRNNAGNRRSIDAFLASPERARGIVLEANADYVAICAKEDQARVLADRAPGGLAAKLLAGETPDWLAPIPLISPMRVFRVVR